MEESGYIEIMSHVYDYGEPENDWLGLDARRVNIPASKSVIILL